MNNPFGVDVESPPDVSVVVPLYCEEASIDELCQRLLVALPSIGRPYEILFVDDGSVDGTAQRIADWSTRSGEIRGIYLARNYGQSTALQAGFDHARGKIVVTMDGDLQNDPADVGRLVKTIEDSGADLVSGWRRNRHDGSLRVALSNAANYLISKSIGVKLHDFGCTLKAYRRDALERIRVHGEMHRFLPVILAEVGAQIVEMEVTHHPRQFGRSKYGFDRILRVVLDLLLVQFLWRWLQRPIHFFGSIGLAMLAAGLAICTWLASLKIFFDESIGSRPMLLLGAMLILIGIILVTQGLIAEVLTRILFESGQRQYRLKIKPAGKLRT